MLEFTHPDTKTGFEAVVDKDVKVFVPGKTNVHGEYHGMLSNVPAKQAETMVVQGCYHLIRRRQPPAAAGKPPKPEEK